MVKTVLKEIIIMLLLCLAIILLLGILLYEYVPMTKTIPNPVSYTTPSGVKQELADSESIDESEIIMTYEVDSTDLNNYATIQDYKPGKANPFSSYETTETTTGTNTTTGNSTTQSTQSQPSSNIDTTTVGTTTNATNVPTTSNNDNASTGIQQTQSVTKEENTTTTSGGHFFQDKGTK